MCVRATKQFKHAKSEKSVLFFLRSERRGDHYQMRLMCSTQNGCFAGKLTMSSTPMPTRMKGRIAARDVKGTAAERGGERKRRGVRREIPEARCKTQSMARNPPQAKMGGGGGGGVRSRRPETRTLRKTFTDRGTESHQSCRKLARKCDHPFFVGNII